MPSTCPIGVFDSGIGGLSIAKQISNLLPNEQLIYVADDQYAPYGDKSAEFLQQRASNICQHLINQGCKLIVVACNTATVNSVAKLRNNFHIPFVGVEPGIKPAIEVTKSGKVAILATEATLLSASFRRLVDIHKKEKQVYLQPCPGLADIIEHEDINSDNCKALLNGYVSPLLEQGVDTVALGCTHYPFIKPLLKSLFDDEIFIIDTSLAVAKQVKRLLLQYDLLSNKKTDEDKIIIHQFSQEKVKKIKALWHANVEIERLHIR